jgi:hypothetical protein
MIFKYQNSPVSTTHSSRMANESLYELAAYTAAASQIWLKDIFEKSFVYYVPLEELL